MLLTPTKEEICLGNEFDALEEAREKRYFPSNASVYHFHPIAFVEQMKLIVIKEDIDLRPLMTFKSQAKGSTNCGTIARNIVAQVDNIYAMPSSAGKGHAYFQLCIENSKATGLIFNKEKSIKAIDYIDRALEYGHPVRAGVNHTLGNKINEDDYPTTDHYVVIVGRKYIQGILYYQYWDVGTFRGQSEHYRFELVDGYKLINTNANAGKGKDGRTYTVSQIARNKLNKKILDY